MNNHNWHSYETPLWTRVTLSDGRKAKRLEIIMRRRLPDGSWEYREFTAEEDAEYQKTYAW